MQEEKRTLCENCKNQEFCFKDKTKCFYYEPIEMTEHEPNIFEEAQKVRKALNK